MLVRVKAQCPPGHLPAIGQCLPGWLGWHFARRFEARLGAMAGLALSLVAMAGLFLGATVIHLLIEHRSLNGGF